MLKNKCAMILSALAVSLGISQSLVNAAPLYDLPTTVTQPNGEELSLLASGDEYFNYLHDEDGNIIIKNDETGYYTYAEVENQIIVPGDVVVTNSSSGDSQTGSPAPISTIIESDIPEEYIQRMYETSPLNQETAAPLRVQSGLVNDRKTHPFLNETVNNLVILIDFPDQTFHSYITEDYLDQLLNTNDNSLKKWFETASYGKTSVSSHVYPASDGTVLATYTDIYPRTTYMRDHRDQYGSDVYMLNGEEISRTDLEHGLLKRAIAAVSSQIPESLDIDVDENGMVDSVTFIIAGKNADWSTLLWSHQWSLNGSASINGKRVGSYIFVMEDVINPSNLYPVATLEHELFHLYGAPDLYSYKDGSSSSVRKWDIMARSDSQMTCTYMKYKYGNWIEKIPEITEDNIYTLNKNTLPENNCYVLRSPYSADEFFVVEYRQKEVPFENSLPGSGIVIFRIHPKTHGNSYANGTTILDEVFVSKTAPNDTYYPSYDNEVNLMLHDGTDAGIKLDRFKLNDDTASFRVSFSYNKLLGKFIDQRIVDAICTALNKTEDEITEQDFAGITSLTINPVGNYDLSVDLTGIDCLTNLQRLYLNSCKIDDISPLRSLTNLTHLELTNNDIEDFSPLENLTSLAYLKLRGNISADYSALAGIYNSLLVKDFSLSGQNDVIFSIPNYNAQQELGTVQIRKSSTVPKNIHMIAEKYSADGTLLHKTKFENFNLIPNRPSFQLSADFRCQDGGYVVISAYERQNFTKLISRTAIKPAALNLTPLRE